MTSANNSHPFASTRKTLPSAQGPLHYYSLPALAEQGVAPHLAKLPYSVRVLLEALLRHCDNFAITPEDVTRLAQWNAKNPLNIELPFKPARVVLQDFTGVPCLVDLAAMRSAMARLQRDPAKINPLVPVDLVIDHSVQVDRFGSPTSLEQNAAFEFSRNLERYEFLRWGQNAIQNFRVVPPATGIVHQVNVEYLARGVLSTQDALGKVIYPDTLVGTDSHTTMINGLGVLGWGVGGIEAEAVMLGQPIYMLTPQVIGARLFGKPSEGVTATDIVLTITQILRKKGVVDKFVEFYGPGLSLLPVADRATIANMAPEYGATCGFFPVDDLTVDFLRRTGRAEGAAILEAYARAQGLLWTADAPEPEFTDTVEIDLSAVVPSLAGPKRPQDRVAMKDMKASFQAALSADVKKQGFGLTSEALTRSAEVQGDRLTHGSVVIAAITSCTNTSNPSVMMAAGLLAKKAAARGLKVKEYVKTSLAPGSQVVTHYLREANLLSSLEALGFYVVGYGCTTCIGNTGPLPEAVVGAIQKGDLVAAAVLSGNRNFEGRISPHVKANYLASPPLVVAYALAGRVDIDWESEAIGHDPSGAPVYLRDIWPTAAEVAQTIAAVITPQMYEQAYSDVFKGPEAWQKISGVAGELYTWRADSSYIQEPPFFMDLTPEPKAIEAIAGARVLALLGDSVTTDHISPAGDIPAKSPAGEYLLKQGVQKEDFNSYGARRGNDRVMVRGTFANIRLKNMLVPGVEGGVTQHLPSQQTMSIYDASALYQKAGTPLIVLAGKEYGTGSSRDWAAKGTLLLGVKAVIAESFERIHRSNLVGMGVLPLVFKEGQNADSLGLKGTETFWIDNQAALKAPRQEINVKAVRTDGSEFTFQAIARLDTLVDLLYYQNGGILPTVLRSLIK